jgi:hypothetical protein
MGLTAHQNFAEVLLIEFNKRFAPNKTFDAINSGLDYGLAVMQNNTPTATGELITSEDASMISNTEGEMHADAEYAGHVNGGTSRMAPQPFFDKGVEAATQKIIDNCNSL